MKGLGNKRRRSGSLAPSRKGGLVPSPHAVDALAVLDGAVTVGTIVERDHSHFAFDHHGMLVGEYASRAEVMPCHSPQQQEERSTT